MEKDELIREKLDKLGNETVNLIVLSDILHYLLNSNRYSMEHEILTLSSIIARSSKSLIKQIRKTYKLL